MKKMTENQTKLLYFIFKYRGQYGTGPTLREMVRELGVSGNKSVLGIIEALTRRGYLKREKKKSRSVLLTDEAQKFLNNYLLPLQYHGGPTAADQLRQPTELARTDIAVLSPTSESLAYKESAIKTNGTSLDNDLHTIVETAVSLALDRYFNGTLPAEQNLKQGVTGVIVNIIRKAFSDEAIVTIFAWGIILTGLTWANASILEDRLTALVYSVVEVVVIKKLLSE
ncbi:MAG: hypothetical protein HYS89_01650 [Candidatus Colwellbacteria bacterium]|nr:hypothetical protein [Candidatus Colwellbacteria bacterium]